MAVAAIATEGWAERPDLASKVILVEQDGSWREVATEGLRMPSVSMSDDTLVVADVEGQVLIGPDSWRRLDRQRDGELGEWSGQVGKWHFSVLNDGTRGEEDGRYFFNLAAWDGIGELVEGEIDQDALGFAACRDHLYAVTRPWNLRDDDLTLTRITVPHEAIVTRSRPVRTMIEPEVRLGGAACVRKGNDAAGARRGAELALLAEERGVPHILFVDVTTARARAVELPELEDAYLLRVVGTIGDEVLIDTHDEVVSVTRDGRVTPVVSRSEQSFTWNVGVSGDEVLVWETEDADHRLRWVTADGEETLTVTVPGVQNELGDDEENVTGSPVSLR